MKLTREQAEQHLNAGRPVAFLAKDQPPRTLQVPEGGRRAVRARLPPEEAEGDYVLLRDEKGNLTRAGMEHTMRTGGTVMLDGRVIEHADDLPSEAELAKGDERREAAVRDALDQEIARLVAQRRQLEAPSEAIQQPPQASGGPHPAAPAAQQQRPRPSPQGSTTRSEGRESRGKPGEEKE